MWGITSLGRFGKIMGQGPHLCTIPTIEETFLYIQIIFKNYIYSS